MHVHPALAAGESRLPPYDLVEMVPDVRGLVPLATNQTERLRWAEQLLRLPEVWRRTQGEGVRVAVLDTGIDPDHPDLAGAIEAVRDFTGEGIEDLNGHGTHCAGIIGARKNDVGFIGTAPLSSLLIGKVLRNSGGGTLDAVADAVHWAVAERVDIVSLSLGAAEGSARLFQAIHMALAKGLVVICAAGNSGALFTNSIGYPGRYGSVITVAAHDLHGQPSGFSSRGSEIDFMAPGHEIWSTYRQGGYAKLSGTSMAAPFVAGLAALVLAKHRLAGHHGSPISNCEDMRQHLLRMAAHPGHHDSARGHGPLLPFAYFAREPGGLPPAGRRYCREQLTEDPVRLRRVLDSPRTLEIDAWVTDDD